MRDVDKIYKLIAAKAPDYLALERYYRGDQPTVYLTERLREIFRNVNLAFTENWCAVVIDSCADRVQLTGLDIEDARAQAVLADAWQRNSLEIESDDIHNAALVTGEGYAIVWPNEAGRAEIYYQPPAMVHIVYDAANPRLKSYAGKLFEGSDGRARMTLYYPDRLEYYIAAKPLDHVTEPAAFVPDTEAGETAPNPYGVIPVFRMTPARTNLSDLTNVIPLQNGINKLLSDMLVAAEFGAFRQRWVISNADTSSLRNAPNEIWQLPAGDGQGQQTQAGEFQATDLKNYLDAIDRLSQAIGVITRTPKHYFYSQGGDPSGEALIALEAPLNRKAQARISRFTPVWREIAAFILQIEGMAVDPTEITPTFEEPSTVQPRTQAEITKIRVDSTVPLKTALRWEGKTDAEIEQMDADAAEAKAAQQSSLAAALLEAERRARQAPMNDTSDMSNDNEVTDGE